MISIEFRRRVMFESSISRQLDALRHFVGELVRPFNATGVTDGRIELLETFDQVMGVDDAVSFLWLIDTDSDGIPELRLDQVFSRAISSMDLEDYQVCLDSLKGYYIQFQHTKEIDPEKIVSIASILPQLNWVSEYIFNSTPAQQLLPLRCQDSRELVGCIQYVYRQSRAAELQDDSKRALSNIVALALAEKIAQIRKERVWNALSSLTAFQPKMDEGLPPTLKRAADVIRVYTGAEKCIIHVPCPHSEFDSAAESPVDKHPIPLLDTKPWLTAIWGNLKPIRIRDASSEDDVKTCFPNSPTIPLAPKTAWMCVPVIAHAKTLAANEEKAGLYLIELFGKKTRGGLYSCFSTTDLNVVNGIASGLTNIIPNIKIRHSLQLISDHFSSFKVPEDYDYAETSSLISELFPCSKFNAVFEVQGEILSNDIWCTRNKTALAEIVNKSAVWGRELIQVRPHYKCPAPIVFVRQIYKVDRHSGYLVLGLEKGRLPWHQREIARYLSQELERVLVPKIYVKENLEALAQIRHNVRATLTGVVGHIQESYDILRIYRNEEPDLAFKHIVQKPRFRRNLEWANLFAQKSRILLEESRFLLRVITPSALKPANVNIRTLIRNVCACIRPEADFQNNEIQQHINVPGDILDVKADPDLFFILLFNIIENAVKYSFDSFPIQVEVTQVRRGWRISVTNIGEHIKSDDQSVIFDVFKRRIENYRVRRKPGTGLGLSVAQQILKAHAPDEDLHVTSDMKPALADGAAETTFWFDFPRSPTK